MSSIILSKQELEQTNTNSILKQINEEEQIIFNQKVFKFNDEQVRQERTLVLTNIYLCNFKIGKFGLSSKQVLQRKIHYWKIKSLIVSNTSSEINIHVPSEFDYRCEIPQKDQFLEIFIKQFNDVTNKYIPVYFVDDKLLNNYQMTKKDAKNKIEKEPLFKPFYFDPLSYQYYLSNLKYHQYVFIFYKVYHTKFEDFNQVKFYHDSNQNKTSELVFKLNQQSYLMFKFLKSDIDFFKGDEMIFNYENPFIMPLQFVFHDENTLYFIVKKYQGLDLFEILRKEKRVSENIAQYIFIQILLCISWLHDKDISYLQLCPENIFIKKSGHIYLQDVFLSQYQMKSDKYTQYCFCEYASPETLEGKPNQSSDLWSLGILLYELVYGIPPFYNENKEYMSDLIIKREVKHLKSIEISENCKDLINQLLIKEHEQRIDAKQVMTHPWVTQKFEEKVDKKQFLSQKTINQQSMG